MISISRVTFLYSVFLASSLLCATLVDRFGPVEIVDTEIIDLSRPGDKTSKVTYLPRYGRYRGDISEWSGHDRADERIKVIEYIGPRPNHARRVITIYPVHGNKQRIDTVYIPALPPTR